ncbi:MAG TPA: PIG-L family deacetylase [Actinoplanes sp.]|nr:PIG-L family deacetylase [Actinoplanes sp.]
MLFRAARAVGRPVHAHTSRWWRRTLRTRAADGTDLVAGRRMMVLSPHPDDETFGCGAVIARARAAHDEVSVVVVTDGRHSTASAVLGPRQLAELRTGELHLACRTLGVDAADIVQLDHEDGTLSGCVGELADELVGLLTERRPDVVLVTCAQDDHPDHEAVHHALLLALRRLPAAGPPAPTVLAYPVWTWMNGPWFLGAERRRQRGLLAWAMRQLRARDWVEIPCGPHLSAKQSAIEAYASQTTNLTGEPSWSYLPPESVSLFLQPSEIFLPVAVRGLCR